MCHNNNNNPFLIITPPGEVVLVSMPADGPAEGWRPQLTDDRGFTATTSFTQQDVDDGAVWYRHFGGGGSDGDSFRFQVGPPGSPSEADFI